MSYCIAVEKELVIATCPLKKGKCYWQHRKTMKCCYTEEELNVQQFCERVGLPITAVPVDTQVVTFLGSLKTALSA